MKRIRRTVTEIWESHDSYDSQKKAEGAKREADVYWHSPFVKNTYKLVDCIIATEIIEEEN